MERPPQQLNPVLFVLARATAHLNPSLFVGMVAIGSVAASGAILAPYLFCEQKDRKMKRWEGALLFTVLAIISAVCMIPFGKYGPAIVGFGFIATINDQGLPKHILDTISGGRILLFDTMKGGFLMLLFDKMKGGLFTLFEAIKGGLFTLFEAITEIVVELNNGVRDCSEILSGISGAVQTVWDAFVLMCKTLSNAASTVWPYAKIEDISRLIFMATALVYAPQVAAGVQRLIEYFAGA